MVPIGDNQVILSAVRQDLVPEDEGLPLGGGDVARIYAHDETTLVGAGSALVAVVGNYAAALVFLAAPDIPLPEGGSLVPGAGFLVDVHPHARLVGGEFGDLGTIGIHAVEAILVPGSDRIDGIVSYGWFVSYELLKSNTWLWLMTNMEKLLCKE